MLFYVSKLLRIEVLFMALFPGLFLVGCSSVASNDQSNQIQHHIRKGNGQARHLFFWFFRKNEKE
jgi:uncharacterized protein YceK